MTDLSALESLLSSFAAGAQFKLDSRSVQAYLEFVEQYASLIPFVDHKNKRVYNWSEVLFMNGNTPEVLANLYYNRAAADGTLCPHQALLLSFLQMLNTPKALLNFYPHAHRDLYYRQLLGLKERAAEPARVALSFELSKGVQELLLPAETLFTAGQDKHGTMIEYTLDNSLLANPGEWTDLRYCYRLSTSFKSCIVYDQAQELPWPTAGLRLFSGSATDPDLLMGRLLVSSLLAVKEGERHKFLVELAAPFFSDNILDALISSGDHWLPLQQITTDVTTTVLEFILPYDAGPVAAPANLDGLTQDVPVLKLAVRYGFQLPEVVSLNIDDSGAVPTGFEQYVLTPFGYSVQEQVVTADQLFLGFSGLKPGQTLSLFWQLQGSTMLTIAWEYLNGHNQWAPLDAVVIDGTSGLFRSGLWSAILPVDASDTALSMPAGRYWLRALMNSGLSSGGTEGASDYPIVLGLNTNGMTATLLYPAGLDSTALTEPLPAYSITQPTLAIVDLAATHQPWPSWGGRPEETHEVFFQRAAERLSHRNRALTWQDMVDLLKTQFSAIYEVVVPPSIDQCRVPAPVGQKLIVIPFNSQKNNADPLRPIFNNATLDNMESYLRARTSLWQRVTVSNPYYRNVQIDYRVIFLPGVNIEYGYRQLGLALEQRYMPWIGGQSEGVTPANRLDYYEVMAAIQEHPLVDHVDLLRLDGATETVQGGSDEVLILQFAVLP